MSRTLNSLKNAKFSLAFQAIAIVIAFFCRKVFVLVLTQEYLGLDGTFANILSMLSLTELGIGSAITYSMYKPLAEGDEKQIVALMHFYKRTYQVIGGIIVAVGLIITPFLSLIIDLPDIPHIKLIFLLYVANSGLSYWFIYKQSLIIADQKQYITSIYHYGFKSVLYILQAFFLWITKEYFVYLSLQLAVTLTENLLLSRKADKLYPYIKSKQSLEIGKGTKNEILKNTIALSAHKVGTIVVNGTDNLLISIMVDVVQTGIYSNYQMITRGLNSVYNALFKALTASVGNLGATDRYSEHAYNVFKRVNFFGGWLYGFSACALFVLLNPFIVLWVGEDYLFSDSVVAVIVINFYISGMRNPILSFRDGLGLYWYDRYKPLIESLINLVASILLALKYGVLGILVGTTISTMLTCFWIEPYVLFKYGLKQNIGYYFKKYIVNTIVTMIACIVTYNIADLIPGYGLLHFAEKMLICAIIPNIIFLAAYCKTNEFKYFVSLLRNRLHKQ